MIYKIDEKDAGLTVKEFLFKRLKLSVAAVKRVKYRDGGIQVNGEEVTVRRVLAFGDTLELLMEDTEEDENEYTLPVNIPIDVVYEDEYFTVVNKPPDMPAHPSLGHKDDTVANALAYRYRDKPFVFRPVNRLDRDTSGLMIVARGKVSAAKLHRLQMKKAVEKSYIAVLEGTPDVSKGQIVTYMRREEGSIVKRCVCNEGEDGAKIAVTDYEVLSSNEKGSVVKATPVTGRTHQLRVHFAHIGCPIYGDTMYGNFSELIGRQALHAKYLSFPHPETEEALHLEASLPKDIEYLLTSLELNKNKEL
ncbi:MAG: RluA family pseudouridine synthase [Ruminococcaceae bacterium]|nr:RluA family pseudouridine synthase [Oscillospiraceae bacterium]